MRISPSSFWWLLRRCSSSARSSCSGLIRPFSLRSWPRGFLAAVAIIVLTHGLEGARQIRMTLESMLEPGDFHDLPAVLVQMGELHLSEQILGFSFQPEERFKSFAVDETGLFEIDDNVDNL